MNYLIKLTFLGLVTSLVTPGAYTKERAKENPQAERPNRPNIVIAMTDDHSWQHISAQGSPFVKTPNVDRLAREGFRFINAYAASPGCSPSRAGLLTGQHHWMIGAAGTHGSYFPAEVKTFVDVLEQDGYKVGYTGKGWGPGSWKKGGRSKNPAGVEYNVAKLKEKPVKGINSTDYAENFNIFMDERKESEPFYFWYGSKEPHLGYQEGPRTKAQLATVIVPGFMPDTPASRSMLLDYADEIHHFDTHLGKILARLEAEGELDNTLIIMTADNGMPMPRAKSNGYDHGIHVPLIMRWAGSLKKGTVIKGTIGFVDLSATILDAAGSTIPAQFVGNSVMNLLKGDLSELEYQRPVFSGRERHSSSRFNNKGYPQRMMRQGDYLLVWNPKPERHPAGDPLSFKRDKLVDGYHDIDNSVAKRELLAKRDDPYISRYFHLAVDKRSEWELFNVFDDPDSLVNLAHDDQSAKIFAKYKKIMLDTLTKTGDLRVIGDGESWEDFPRLSGPMRKFPSTD